MRTIPRTRDDVTSMTPGDLREAFSFGRRRAKRPIGERLSLPAAAEALLEERTDLPPVWVALLRLVAFLAVVAIAVSGVMAILVFGIAAVVRGLTAGVT
jgi:hypothetical protein